MGWGILDDPKTPWPPGTVLLDDVKQAAMIDTSGSQFAHLKKDKHIILQPQPTDSVNDPLNWPLKRKMTIIFTLIVTGVAVGGMMAMLGTAGRLIAERFHVSYPVSRIPHHPQITISEIGLETDLNVKSTRHSE
jgi:hypothetical protein